MMNSDYSTRKQMRLKEIIKMIESRHPEIQSISIIDIKQRENRSGNPIISDMIFAINNSIIFTVSLPRGIDDTTVSEVIRKFNIEYHKFCESL